jgi:eukaryotic-like serine/threonine-protein kinase
MESRTDQIVNGYRIGPLLGAGGMGAVYQAFPADESAPPVAIKFLQNENSDDPSVQGRFAREIRIMQEMKHPHVMPIYESGIFEGNLYYTMRLIKGMTLTNMMRRSPFTPSSFGEVLRQLCDALHFGHENGLVHRDVKPDNIFVERDRAAGTIHVFLGDFGLGKRAGKDVTLTEADAVLGTPHYISPEGATGESLDRRSDIYALGIITYEALLNVLPFNEAHGHLTAMAHVIKPVPLPTAHNPNFPAALEHVILQALEKERDDRPATAQLYLEQYQAAVAQLGTDEREANYQVN